MNNSLKTEKFKNIVAAFIFFCLAYFFPIPDCFSTGMNRVVHISEIRWRKEYKAIIDGRISDCAFSGGMEYSKPTFLDIDADGDLDLFIGGEGGRISFFRNDGTKEKPQWSFVSDYYDSIDVGEKSTPCFADIDDDGDFDLFGGNEEGRIVFYQNDGDSTSPLWAKITDNYDSIDVGDKSVPVFVDIDSDSDLDLFIGEKEGGINFYRNDGTKKAPFWNLASENYSLIDVGAGSAPFFVDIDNDADFDLFIGEDYGNINFYRNIGTPNSPEWDLVTSDYSFINVGRNSSPYFIDIDDDSDFDLFIGEKEGRVYFYRNDGTPWLPDWDFVPENYVFIDLGIYTKPALADLDGDGDFDLFIGEGEGNINFYRNEATLPVPSLTLVTENYYAIEAEDNSQPTFADIDSDGDLDLFVGKDDGQAEFYQNIGSSQSPSWMWVSDDYYSIEVGSYSSPAFVDIDRDFDLDLFIGKKNGRISFYLNDGTPQEPSWILVSESYNSIYVEEYSAPAFADLDLDGDFDLLVGCGEGEIFFYRNEGTPEAEFFVFVSDYFGSIHVGDQSTPSLCDFDSDGDPDLFIGEGVGGLHFYKNLTFNSIRGKVTDYENNPLIDVEIYLSGDRNDVTLTDSLGGYQFIGLPVGAYCVYRDPEAFQYCFTPLDSDTFDIDFLGTTDVNEEQYPLNLTPNTFHLYQNYPNPFNPTTNMPFTVCGSHFMVHCPIHATHEKAVDSSWFMVDSPVHTAHEKAVDSSWFIVDSPVHTTLKIYNIRGELVKTLVDEPKEAGSYEAIWDGKDENGNQVASGIYFYQLRMADRCETKKMILVK